MSENALSVNKTLVLFAIVSSAIIMAGILATMPSAGRLEAREQTKLSPCHTEQVSLDEGYGVSRVVERRVCDDY